MAIEKAPSNPVHLHGQWPPGDENKYEWDVRDEDDWWKIARAFDIDVWQLIHYNFKTRNPDEVNWYLRELVGCVNETPDGKNYVFHGANPSRDPAKGKIYIPPGFVTRVDGSNLDNGKNGSLPAHPQAYEEIQLYYLEEKDLPRGIYLMERKFNITVKETIIPIVYRLIPVVNDHNDHRVLFYIAYNVSKNRTEWVIGPSKLAEFRRNGRKYAERAYGHFNMLTGGLGGDIDPHQREVARSLHRSLKGKGGWENVKDMFTSGVALGWKTPPLEKPLGMRKVWHWGKSKLAGRKALKRLESTRENLQNKHVHREAKVLTEDTNFRHSITADSKYASYAGMERDGYIRMAKPGVNAQYGVGVYAWQPGTTGIGPYIDIRVPRGVAVEKIVGRQTFYRLVPPEGKNVPIKIIGTNLTEEQKAVGRMMIGHTVKK